jgi:exodeoxyribonuclease-3
LKIASWNVNSIRARLEHVQGWLNAQSPDVLAIQETKVQDQDFPAEDLAGAGYKCIYSGQRAYHGVAVLSRSTGTTRCTELPGFEDPQRRVLGVEFDGLFILDLYVPNGASIDSDKYTYKLQWLDALHDYCQALLEEFPQLVVVGDFNIAPADRDVHDPEKWAGQVLVSEPERQRLERLMSLGLVDTFRLFDQPAEQYSWWDYRAAAFRRNHGLRIDLILVSKLLAKRCRKSWIDSAPRRLEKPSDHAPVLAEFDL